MFKPSANLEWSCEAASFGFPGQQPVHSYASCPASVWSLAAVCLCFQTDHSSKGKPYGRIHQYPVQVFNTIHRRAHQTLTDAKWDVKLAVNGAYLLAQRPPQDSGDLIWWKLLSLDDDVFVCDLGHETHLYHAFWFRKLLPLYHHAELPHHYEEGTFILIFQTNKQEFRKLKTMQPRTGKVETGSKVSNVPNLLMTSWEEPHVCLPGRLGSKSSWMDTVVGGLYLEGLNRCKSVADSLGLGFVVLSSRYTQICVGKGHSPLLLVKIVGQRLILSLVIHIFTVGLTSLLLELLWEWHETQGRCPSTLDSLPCFLPEPCCSRLFCAFPLTGIRQEDAEAGQSMGICQLPFFCYKKWSWGLERHLSS